MESIPPTGPLPALLGTLARWLAAAGGLLLVAIALMTVASVAGRVFLSSPIQGDVELVQLACAVAVSWFLPWTQWQRSNIMVDFFTAGASDVTRRRLDALGTLALGLVMALVCWRTAAGGLAARDNEEVSMLLAVPVWIPYALMTPGLGLTALVSFHRAWEQATGRADHG